jgi:mono/diheme cytochrome c family protein
MTRVISAIAFASILSILGACQPGDQPGPEYMPDMARGPAYKAFAPNQATRNGITLQRPVAGTIARGHQPFHYGKGDAEAARAGRELTNPFHPTAQTLEKGKALYQIYCLVCHGEAGKADGPIATKIPTPPSYQSERLLGYPPGRIFHVITMGANKMPSYAVQLAPEERWQVITYVRSQLQGLPEAPPGTGSATEPGSMPPPASGATPTPAPSSGGRP